MTSPTEGSEPFYVACDVCLNCGHVATVAPHVITIDPDTTLCSVLQQPTNAEEEYQAVRASLYSCTMAVRYRGSDPTMRTRLAELGLGYAIDGVVPDAVNVEFRRFATFRRADEERATDVLTRIVDTMVDGYRGAECNVFQSESATAGAIYRWTHVVPGILLTLAPCESAADRWSLRIHRPSPHIPEQARLTMATTAHDALTALNGSRDVRWYRGVPTDRPWGEWSRFPL